MSSAQTDEHGQARDRRGEWRPKKPAGFMPLLDWPQRPAAVAKWFFGVPGFFAPWYAIYAALTCLAYFD